LPAVAGISLVALWTLATAGNDNEERVLEKIICGNVVVNLICHFCFLSYHFYLVISHKSRNMQD
jgi:hypothetical protein